MKTKTKLTHVAFSFTLGLVLQLSVFTGSYAQGESQKDSVVFNFKPEEQTWIVPQGVSLVHVAAFGAQGGSARGGKGGKVESDLQVSPGNKLSIYVGSQPINNEGGFNGGGKGCGNGTGGGGATDIRIGSNELDSRVLVAGGGGGVGYGGSAGAGGGLTGGEGKYDTSTYHIARGGTQEAGGKGARAYFSTDGKIGNGGDGINSHGNCSNNAMAGGGAGYYGGGGGGAGGGGGGSSYTNSNNKNVIHEQGVHEGNGRLVIYWVRPKK